MASDLKTSLTADTSDIVDQQEIDAADVTAAISDLLTLARSARVGVSENATHIGHLIDVLAATSPVTLAENNDGGNETLTIALNAAMTALAASVNGSGSLDLGALDTGAAAADTPLVANGSGGATTGSPGAANPEDVTITAGEALSVRDFVCVRSDNKAYKWRAAPINSSSYENGLPRGVVVDSGIAANATGKMRVSGQVSGFSGLTAWEPVFVDDGTDGLITQTVPNIASQSRTDIVQVGKAISGTTISVKEYPIRCITRGNVGNNAAQNVFHMPLKSTILRRVWAYLDDNADKIIDLGVNGVGSTADYEANIQNLDYAQIINRTGGTKLLVAVVEIDG